MKVIRKILMFFGIIGVGFYVAHIIVGESMWKAYDPITRTISALTNDGAPNKALLTNFVLLYNFCVLIFSIGFIIKSYDKYFSLIRIGSVLFLISHLLTISAFFFPLKADTTSMTFQNIVHVILYIAMLIMFIISIFFIALGYLRQEENKFMGVTLLFLNFIIIISSILNAVHTPLGIYVVGIIERVTIYSILVTIGLLSLYNTFSNDLKTYTFE